MIVVNLLSNTQQVPVSVCQSWDAACFLPTFKIISKYRLSKSQFRIFLQQRRLFMLKKKKEKSSSIVFIFDCSKPVLIFWKDFKHAIKYRIVCHFLASSVFFVYSTFCFVFKKTRFVFFLSTSAHLHTHTTVKCYKLYRTKAVVQSFVRNFLFLSLQQGRIYLQ